MKAILIDPFKKQVSEVEVNEHHGDIDMEHAYELLGCNCVDVARFDRRHLAMVDDNGLLGDLSKQAFFMVRGCGQPLGGKALILSEKGEHFAAPLLSVTTMWDNVAWLSLEDCRALAGGQFPPHIRVISF